MPNPLWFMKLDSGTLWLLTVAVTHGWVWEEGDEIVGRAKDGVKVSLGYTHDVPAFERYFRNNPRPDCW